MARVAGAVDQLEGPRREAGLALLAALERVLGVTAAIEFLPMQPGDVPATHADTSKLRAWVGYAPTTELESGLTRFKDWYNAWS